MCATSSSNTHRVTSTWWSGLRWARVIGMDGYLLVLDCVVHGQRRECSKIYAQITNAFYTYFPNSFSSSHVHRNCNVALTKRSVNRAAIWPASIASAMPNRWPWAHVCIASSSTCPRWIKNLTRLCTPSMRCPSKRSSLNSSSSSNSTTSNNSSKWLRAQVAALCIHRCPGNLCSCRPHRLWPHHRFRCAAWRMMYSSGSSAERATSEMCGESKVFFIS